ncbi:MAG: hypothetical protein HYR96_08225 [Deltaproteobacteria bacterium]|nr:hypothetical protein [Deltaproteobacteria bacterium]
MTDNRRPPAGGGNRSRRPARSSSGSINRPRRPHYREHDDRVDDEVDERRFDEDRDEGPVNPDPRIKKEVPARGQAPARFEDEDRDEDRQPDEYEEPFENQPAYLGKMSDVESQPSDEYVIETHFDRDAGQFTGSILEFPELKAMGPSREVVVNDLEAQLGQRLESLRTSGGAIPEPLSDKQYPETMQIRLTQSLYRKLDRLSRFEKIEIDRLVSELIVRALERRPDVARSEPRSDNRRHHYNNHRGGGRHQQGGRRGGGGQHRGGGGRGRFDANQSGENFMEYVRNLESRGGNTGGNWKKR